MQLKPFIELLRRTLKSKYHEVMLHNRMMMNCYTIDIDSDVGLHYILHIPNIEEYSDPLYDISVLITPADIISEYKSGHDELAALKKERGVKAKDVREELEYVLEKHYLVLKMQFILQDELITTKTCKLSYPVNLNDPVVENIVNTYTQMLDRIKVGGRGVAIDGIKHGLFERAMETGSIVYYKIKLGNDKVNIPVFRSMFLGQSSFDEFFISLQETELPAIYLYTVQLERKNIIEQFIGYIINYTDAK